ncbi:polysaccharide biosynthesis/export family protein [Pedobacter psychrodurus]|uniref:polysaccharide biosynthesis/export family protein n=1 Tax=Pedobacter psychrodurus TaxID=2530456 RepID=UPI00292FD3C7|nr:polysaccharide biosynthesis/export family protein [Pedobacter psychrodurus]
MNRKITIKQINISVIILLVVLISSCVSTKNVPYFQDVSLAGKSVLESTADYSDPKIQVDDILSISIFTGDPENTGVVNQVSSVTTVGQQQVSGYLVDKKGEIELAVIGKIKLAGLTTFEARDTIRSRAKELFKNPTVQVRFANFKVTVLGEVARPAAYTLPNEKVSVLDAIGLAGDLTIYGKRENILLIREVNGKKEFARLNLNSEMLFKSSYFYLKQNDVIYVEPNKARVAANNAARTQTFAIIGSALSVAIVLISRVF